MDQSCWIYQMAHLSSWYRCVVIDLPGYGRSPNADPGLTMGDMAEACWEALDNARNLAPEAAHYLIGWGRDKDASSLRDDATRRGLAGRLASGAA